MQFDSKWKILYMPCITISALDVNLVRFYCTSMRKYEKIAFLIWSRSLNKQYINDLLMCLPNCSVLSKLQKYLWHDLLQSYYQLGTTVDQHTVCQLTNGDEHSTVYTAYRAFSVCRSICSVYLCICMSYISRLTYSISIDKNGTYVYRHTVVVWHIFWDPVYVNRLLYLTEFIWPFLYEFLMKMKWRRNNWS